jgi:hypothetical protein
MDFKNNGKVVPTQSFAPVPNFEMHSQKDTRDFRTETQNEYSDKGLCIRKSLIPSDNQLNSKVGAFEGVTTKMADYPAWGHVNKVKSCRPSQGLTDTIGTQSNDGNDSRSFVTENRKQFDNKGYQVRPTFRPEQREVVSLQLDSSTTTKDSYKNWSGCKPSTPYREPTLLHANGPETRDFQTEATLKFIQHPGSNRRQPFEPAIRQRHDAPFESETTNRNDYKMWTQKPCPAKTLPLVATAKDGHMNYQRMGSTWAPQPVAGR